MVKIVLTVLAKIFHGVTLVRNVLYDKGIFKSYTSTIPVVSVGNVTVGGNGKTPLCQYLAADLLQRGYKPVILSRGYGGTVRGPYKVRLTDNPDLVGDEPLLLARTTGVPVYVSKSRVSGVQRIEEEGIGNVIILDDGFQHRALARDFDIVSIFIGSDEGVHTFLSGELLPQGRFREQRERALQRADAIVLSERRVFGVGESLPAVEPSILKILPAGVPVFRSILESKGVVFAHSDALVPQGPVLAFAGIASPEGFFDSVRRLGFTVIEEQSFPDHHKFSLSDITQLKERAIGRPIVCTEKDLVKIRQIPNVSLEGIAVVLVAPKVVPSDAFGVTLLRACRR